MRMRGWIVVVVLLGGCTADGDDEVVDGAPVVDSSSEPDGSSGPDAAPAPDAFLPDAAPTGTTAVFVADISTFAAVGDVYTKIAYSVEETDDLDEYDPSTYRFTPKTPGDYHVCASLFKAVYTPFLAMGVVKNDSTTVVNFAHNPWWASGCTTVRLVSGDYIDVRVQQGPSAFTFNPDATRSWLSIHRVDAAVFAETDAVWVAANSAFSTAIYGREVLDDAAEWNPTTSRFTAATGGDIQVCASATGGSYFVYELDTFLNGARDRGFSFQGVRAPGCRTLRVVAGDIVDVRAFQATGADATYVAFAEASWISIAHRDTQASAGIGGAFNLLNDTPAKLPYSAEIFDDSGEYDPTTSRFTSTAGGDYEVCAALENPLNTFAFELRAYTNGVREKDFAIGAFKVAGCAVVRLAAGEYVEIFGYQASGSTISFDPAVTWGWLTIDKL